MLTNPPTSTAQPSRHADRRVPFGWLTIEHVWLAAALMLIAPQGAIPTVDSFSYTRSGAPFYNQGWLAQIFMYALYQAGGIPLILIVQALVIALAYGLLLRLCIRRSDHLRLSVALLLLTTMPLSFTNWIVR